MFANVKRKRKKKKHCKKNYQLLKFFLIYFILNLLMYHIVKILFPSPFPHHLVLSFISFIQIIYNISRLKPSRFFPSSLFPSNMTYLKTFILRSFLLYGTCIKNNNNNNNLII